MFKIVSGNGVVRAWGRVGEGLQGINEGEKGDISNAFNNKELF